MESIVIFKSIHHGNTKKIAEKIAMVLDGKLIEPEEFKLEDLSTLDIIGFGSGIYYGDFHEDIFDLIKDLPKVKNKKAFIFSTSGLPKIPFLHDYENNIKKELLRKGFEIIDTYSCRGWDTYFPPVKIFGGIHKGKPDESDLEEVKKFSKSLKNSK